MGTLGQLTHMQVLPSQLIEMQLSQLCLVLLCLQYSKDTRVLWRPWASFPSHWPQFKLKQKPSICTLWALEDCPGKGWFLLSGTRANLWQACWFKNSISWGQNVTGMWHSIKVLKARREMSDNNAYEQPVSQHCYNTLSYSFQIFLPAAHHLPREIRIPLP